MMCVSVPAKVIAVEGKKARVAVWEQEREVFLSFDNVKIGDWLLCYGNLAVGPLDEKSAEESLALLKNLT